MQFLSPNPMAQITVTNISKEPQRIRPTATAEKVTLKAGESIVCDRDYAEQNCLSNYGELFRATDGDRLPGLKEVLTFIEKATDAEKEAIQKALAPAPAKKAAKA